MVARMLACIATLTFLSSCTQSDKRAKRQNRIDLVKEWGLEKARSVIVTSTWAKEPIILTRPGEVTRFLSHFRQAAPDEGLELPVMGACEIETGPATTVRLYVLYDSDRRRAGDMLAVYLEGVHYYLPKSFTKFWEKNFGRLRF